MENYTQLKELVLSMEEDVEKFYSKGNSAAGTRLRKTAQDIKNVAQRIRTEVSEIKNSK
jgi:hypothetical protein